MNTVLVAGYPKSGNTLLGTVLNKAGNVNTDFDYYHLKKSNSTPSPNKLFNANLCTIKTHEIRRLTPRFDRRYYGHVKKLITITRNPLETLLSSISYLRYKWVKTKALNPSEKLTLDLLLPNCNFEDLEKDLILESMRDKGHLEEALKNFINMGTVIPMFFESSGPWSEFTPSYANSNVPTLNLRYEELALEGLDYDKKNSHTSIKLSEFLECKYEKIKEAFIEQTKSVKNQKSAGNLFFAKAASGYWREYFSTSLRKRFVNIYHHSLMLNGYEDFIEEIMN